MIILQITEYTNYKFYILAVTGLQAGANISGDLKDPASSIPKGTLLALLISAISYAAFVVFAGGSALRDASGNVADLVNGTMIGVVPACLNNTVRQNKSYITLDWMNKIFLFFISHVNMVCITPMSLCN